jgi:hypothetical protein
MITRFIALVVLLACAPAFAEVYYDRVKETTTTTGSGNITLAGAVSGFRTFNSTVGVGPTFPYFIAHRASAEWEAGTAVLSGATTLVRTPQASSNGGVAVVFTTGTKDVYLAPTARSFTGYCAVDGSTIITGQFVFEGTTADGFETTFVITDPTADRDITFKNESGTVAFLSDITNMSAADILAALLTVDGSGSGLDADLLDGISSAAFVLATDYEDADVLAKLLNVDGAGSGLDADLLDGVSSAGFCTTSGCTMTGATTYSGTAPDISVPAAQDFTWAWVSNDETTILRADNAIGRMDLLLNPVAGEAGHGLRLSGNQSAGANIETTLASGGIIYFTGVTGIRVGAKTDLASNVEAVTFSDGVSVPLARVYGSGAFGIVAQQTITISTGDDTTSPTSSQVELLCTTPPCTWKPGETSAVDGWQIRACNIDTDSIDVASAAGTAVVTGSPVTFTPGECIACTYSGAIWGCR